MTLRGIVVILFQHSQCINAIHVLMRLQVKSRSYNAVLANMNVPENEKQQPPKVTSIFMFQMRRRTSSFKWVS